MDTGYFQSREFAVAAALAVLLVGGGIVAAAVVPQPFNLFGGPGGCRAAHHDGSPVEIERQIHEVETGGAATQENATFTFTPGTLAPGHLSGCVDVGSITILPSSSDTVRITFRVGDGSGRPGDLAAADPQARFTENQGVVDIAFDHLHTPKRGSWFQDESPYLDVTVELPVGWTAAVDVWTTVGDLRVGAVALASLRAHTDVGDIETTDVRSDGPVRLATDVGNIVGTLAHTGTHLTARTDVGDIDLTAGTVGQGTWTLRTDVGNVDLRLPRAVPPGADDGTVGYNATLDADVGSARVDLGALEREVRRESAPGAHIEARTIGYDGRAVQVRLDVRTDVGDIDVRTA